jgi:riboflavin kinase/FMN adenylyltransferase
VALLRTLGAELKFTVHGLAAVSLDGTAVSSTRIREAIREGELDSASQMLGRAYSIAGRVVRGAQVGRQLGFPTANLDVSHLMLPPNGVYVVQATVRGETQRGVSNIGYRPTLQTPAPQVRMEVHLIDFSADLYGEELEVTFLEKLRAEQEFASKVALADQIARDITEARLRF